MALSYHAAFDSYELAQDDHAMSGFIRCHSPGCSDVSEGDASHPDLRLP